jgi:hypothetical protein
VCLSQIAVGPRLARSYLGAIAVTAWLIFGLATIESPPKHAGAPPKAAKTCFCELRSTISQAYFIGRPFLTC